MNDLTRQQLISLVHLQLDQALKSDQLSQLESLLREDWEARRLYLEFVDQHARLLSEPTLSSGRLVELPHPRRGWQVAWKPMLAVAAGLLLAFSIWPRTAIEKEATSNGCAILSQAFEAEFLGNGLRDEGLRNGDTLMPGTISLAKGLAQIEFFSGATVLIEGAGEIEVISAWEARCISGRVRVQVPPAAKGFLMHAPGVKLEDLGTEFALNVDAKTGSCALHVFEGEVIAHPTSGVSSSLTQGMGFRRNASETIAANDRPQDFLTINELQGLVSQRQTRCFERWQAWSLDARNDPRLIAYYTFKHWPDDRWDRLINNFALPPQKQRAGGAVGARWTEGRWPGKEALEFKRPGDRIRMNLDGTYTAITLACWVKVDAVDKKYNSLLLTDGYDNGEPHWQIYEDGSLMFSIMYRPSDAPKSAKFNQMYFSKPVFTTDSLGRWHHLAVTYESRFGNVIQYFDGQEVSREISSVHRSGREIVIGPCEIGNWGLPTPKHEFPIRSLNGAIDEFAIYSMALNDAEIQEMFEQGKPE